MDVTSASLIARTAASVIPGVLQIKEALKTKDPIPPAQIVPIDINGRHMTEKVKEAKGVLDKGQDLDLKSLGNLANEIAEAEIYVDFINYIFKNKLEEKTDWKPIQEEVDKLLVRLGGLIQQPTNKDKHPENHLSGHEMPPGNVRRCILYLSRFPKGSVFNRNRITRQGNTTTVTHEFIAGDSGMPSLQQPVNFLQVVEDSFDEDRAPYHFLICDDVAERTSTWPETKYFFREAFPESTESIPYKHNHSSLISLGGRNLTLNLEELKFWYQIKNLSLRNITLKNEGFLKKLSLLQYLDLKYTNVQGCDWLEGLEDLEMLDLRYTDVMEIPEKCLQKLGKLQHLLLGYRPNVIEESGDKRYLQRLAGVKLNTTKEMEKNLKTLRTIRRPDQLRSLSKVADLSVTGFKTGDLKCFWGAVKNFENLTSLGVAVTIDSDITLKDCPAKLKNKLRRLRMEGKFSHSGLAELGNFTKLIDLTLASHEPINIDSIPKLSKLFCLRLYSFCTKETLILKIQGFVSLKKLVIGDMEKVKTVQIASDVIKKVDTLKLCNLRKFRELICHESNSQPHLLRRKESQTMSPIEVTKPGFYKLDDQETKTIFLRGFEDMKFEKSESPRLKIYHYDMNKQCYQEVPVVQGTNNQS